jgi:hypothetical protein
MESCEWVQHSFAATGLRMQRHPSVGRPGGDAHARVARDDKTAETVAVMMMRTCAAACLSMSIGAVAVVAPAGAVARRSSLEAYFPQRSSLPGRTVRLVVLSRGQQLSVQLFRAGLTKQGALPTDGLLGGAAVAAARTLAPRGPARRSVTIWLRRTYPSGLYYARIKDGHGDVAVAPLVLRRLPRLHRRVAVVLPTNTWQAYNYRDDNGDGVPDSWYADPRVRSVALDRPFLHHGVPPHYRQYDMAFQRWLARGHHEPDFLADDDLEAISGTQLRRRYDLIVFPGHEEYVTTRAYDLVKRYRDTGGNLMFLSANNFFYRVTRSANRIARAERWRDLGRPEARWIGIQYLDWNRNLFHNAPYVVTGARTAPWLFRGTGLTDGQRFGSYGIEIDARTSSSPRATVVLARAPNIFGRGRSAEMSYHQTPAGAKVFAAGAINFGGSASNAKVSAMLDNLWGRLRRS